MHVEESSAVVATTTTFVPPVTDPNNEELSPKANLRAFVMPAEQYLLSVTSDSNISRHRPGIPNDVKGNPKHRLLRKASLERL